MRAMMWHKPFVLRNSDGVPGGSVPPVASEPAAPAAPAPSETISLTKAEYGQMMGAIAALQAQLDAKEEPAAPAPSIDPNDLDRMSGAQLANFILSSVQQQVGQPLLNQIMTLAVKEELREVQSAHPDFKELKDEVYKEAQANTHLSLEQAYLIVKQRKTGVAPPVPPKVDPPPPAAPPAPPVGSKPGITTSSVAPNGGMSIREAAEAALKTLQLET